MSVLKGVIPCVAAAVLAAGGQARAVDIPRSSDATYLYVCQDPAGNVVPIDLAALGVSPGQMIGLEILGDWDESFFETGGDVHTGTWAVFSSSAVLLATNQPHRVPGAIAAGNPVTTPSPYLCNQESTDIPEDFAIPAGSPLVLVVPPGATHLFTSPADWLFYDNADPDSDYALRITIQPISVESMSWSGVKGLYRD
jgi:hypothetical protein